MGTWGASLYEDDTASDMKNAVTRVAKVPADGDQLLACLLEMYGPRDPADEDGILFWLVVADQFERRGIGCDRAASAALAIIESGADLHRASAGGADEAFVRKRAGVLAELAQRLKAPRPTRDRPRPRKAPDVVLETGEIHSFRTMNGRAWHLYRLDREGPFVPDGWGALVVLATGRAFDRLPWVARASLTVDPNREATVNEALQARLIPHLQTRSAGRYVPKRAHAEGLGLRLPGKAALDDGRVAPPLSTWSILRAIKVDWTIA